MTRKEKLLQKMKNNPKSVKFEDIDKIMREVGFERRQPSRGSSHYTYSYKDKTLTVPYNRPFIKVIYIKMALQILEELGH